MHDLPLNPNTGSLELNGQKVFYKYLPVADFYRELNGYNALRRYYPVPMLLDYKNFGHHGLLLFEYEESVDKNKGLLVDAVASGKSIESAYLEVLHIYRSVFKATLKQDIGQTAQVFFNDRVPTRLVQFYPEAFVRKVDGATLAINGEKVVIRLRDMLTSIKAFFKDQKPTRCVLSQCDPHDLNIGLKPIIFDFTAGGHNPLMAEFATQFWYNLAQGSYLSPKYNTRAFIDHDRILAQIDSVEQHGVDLQHKISDTRRALINLYIDNIIVPLFEQMGDFPEWYTEFKNYLAMKMLAVFDVSKMEPLDRDLTLAYASKFYYSNLVHPNQLKEIL